MPTTRAAAAKKASTSGSVDSPTTDSSLLPDVPATKQQQQQLHSPQRLKTVLAAAVFIDLFAVSLIVPMLPVRMKELGMNPVAIGTLSSIYSAAQIVGGLGLGVLGDRLEDRRTVRSTKKACNSSTMAILAPIALLTACLLGRECCAYYLFSSHGNLHCS